MLPVVRHLPHHVISIKSGGVSVISSNNQLDTAKTSLLMASSECAVTRFYCVFFTCSTISSPSVYFVMVFCYISHLPRILALSFAGSKAGRKRFGLI